MLIIGSLAIGWISGPSGGEQLSPLVVDLFVGILCLFLLAYVRFFVVVVLMT